MNIQSQILPWMTESLTSFISELSLSKSEPTVHAYRYDVGRFLEYLSDRGVKRMSSLKPVYIVDYLGECKVGGKSDASLNRYYMSIRSYCQFLRRNKFFSFDLTEDISAPRCVQKAPFVPTQEEVNKLLQQPDQSTESGVRDLAMLELLYSSGLRASELCDLELEDVKENCIVVKCGKRGKSRTVPMTQQAKEVIAKYIDTYRTRADGYLFLTLGWKKMRRQLLCSIVMDYAKKAGLKGVTTHTLRHACATHLLDHGADLRLIQEVLGHSSIASTQRYTHLSSAKIEQMFTQFHPRKVAVWV